MAFIDRLLPAPRNGGFARKDNWVWCGSVIRGEDNRYHMFASSWSRTLPFWPNWVTNSTVVRASSDTPEGPYAFEEVVLGPHEGDYWDARMAHNPTIHKCGDTYLLYYTGTTYDHPLPTPDHPIAEDKPLGHTQARLNQRIGLATAKSIFGPWKRRDHPILPPEPGRWDGQMNCNPAPCVLEDGSVLLVYKAIGKPDDLLRLGVAKAPHFDGPYERLTDKPIFNFDATGDHVEDACIWHSGDQFQLIMKDMRGGICGEKGGGIHASSPEGVDWNISDPPKAYSRTVLFEDGVHEVFDNFERPQLLIQSNRPTHLFAAVSIRGKGEGHQGIVDTWNLCLSLKTD